MSTPRVDMDLFCKYTRSALLVIIVLSLLAVFVLVMFDVDIPYISYNDMGEVISCNALSLLTFFLFCCCCCCCSDDVKVERDGAKEELSEWILCEAVNVPLAASSFISYNCSCVLTFTTSCGSECVCIAELQTSSWWLYEVSGVGLEVRCRDAMDELALLWFAVL